MIEVALQKYNYEDVYKSFSEYRDRRSQSRQAFLEDKRLHKISQIFEGLVDKSSTEDDTKRENANIDGNSSMGTMLQLGSTIGKELAKTYFMKKKFAVIFTFTIWTSYQWEQQPVHK